MKITKYYIGTSLFLTLAISACGSSSAKPAASPTDTSMASAESASTETTPEPATSPAVETPNDNPALSAPAPVDLMAAEMAAYERAEPVFKEQCGGCHMPDSKRKKPKKGVGHFAMGSYPFEGHHKTELGQTIRVAIGATDKPATMPQDDPGSIEGTDLEAIVAWSDAFDAAASAGVGYHANEAGGGHGHKSKHEHMKKDHDHKAKPEHKMKHEGMKKSHDHKAKHEHKKKAHDHKAKPDQKKKEHDHKEKKHEHKPKHEHGEKHDH